VLASVAESSPPQPLISAAAPKAAIAARPSRRVGTRAGAAERRLSGRVLPQNGQNDSMIRT
jgi:hypothetical protein